MTRVDFQVDNHLQKSCNLRKSRDLMDLGEDLPGCRPKGVCIPVKQTILEAYEKKNELKLAIDKIILVTQVYGGQETIQAAK